MTAHRLTSPHLNHLTTIIVGGVSDRELRDQRRVLCNSAYYVLFAGVVLAIIQLVRWKWGSSQQWSTFTLCIELAHYFIHAAVFVCAWSSSAGLMREIGAGYLTMVRNFPIRSFRMGRSCLTFILATPIARLGRTQTAWLIRNVLMIGSRVYSTLQHLWAGVRSRIPAVYMAAIARLPAMQKTWLTHGTAISMALSTVVVICDAGKGHPGDDAWFMQGLHMYCLACVVVQALVAIYSLYLVSWGARGLPEVPWMLAIGVVGASLIVGFAG